MKDIKLTKKDKQKLITKHFMEVIEMEYGCVSDEGESGTIDFTIDELDSKLIDFLGKRMQVAEKIGQLKKEKNVAILQNKRWNEILGKMI